MEFQCVNMFCLLCLQQANNIQNIQHLKFLDVVSNRLLPRFDMVVMHPPTPCMHRFIIIKPGGGGGGGGITTMSHCN